MKFKKIAAIISAAAVALALTGCGNDDEIFYPAPNNQQSGQSSGKLPAVQPSDIPVTDASAFEYEYVSELDGMGITKYKGDDPKVHIPDKLDNKKVVAIGGYAFSGCTSLTHVIIPDSVTWISSYAFSLCTSLKSITIPDSVTVIGSNAFSYTPWLDKRRKNNPLVVVNNILIDGETCSGDVTIPDSVTKIVSSAFSGCTSLTSITIPNGVTEIGGYAFSDCTSLTSITIGNGVTEIGEYAFESCTSLTSIKIPNSVTKIGEYAFNDCTSLTSISIPDSVTQISWSAFDNCENIQATYKGKTYDYEHIYDLYYDLYEATSGYGDYY